MHREWKVVPKERSAGCSGRYTYRYGVYGGCVWSECRGWRVQESLKSAAFISPGTQKGRKVEKCVISSPPSHPLPAPPRSCRRKCWKSDERVDGCRRVVLRKLPASPDIPRRVEEPTGCGWGRKEGRWIILSRIGGGFLRHTASTTTWVFPYCVYLDQGVRSGGCTLRNYEVIKKTKKKVGKKVESEYGSKTKAFLRRFRIISSALGGFCFQPFFFPLVSCTQICTHTRMYAFFTLIFSTPFLSATP